MLGENNELKIKHLLIDSEIDKPKIQTEELKVTIGGQKTEAGGQKRWSENVIKLIELIQRKPDITRKELSEALKINSSAVQKHLEKLKNEGVISREGSDKKGNWKVINF